ncbi:hypothetical protein CFC21_090745 [Triticum aestivum]|uniref:Uncharacterized protein n=2 Tax=Triticum aestivum TaxID=4565 RepID=A0A9R1MSA4_WHEAT|nr:uncharacterized protein LOC123142925 [Triticum aestivum]KAF7087566.1 hypothetical protein CFC21_090745 [Triticum aestivum]
MVAMGMGSTKRGVVWCAGLLVTGLLLVAAEADFCSEDCRGKTDFLGRARRCRSQLEVARPTNCVALCHGKPNFMACCNRHRYARRVTPHLQRRAGRESTTHEEEARGGAVGVLKAPAPAPCEVVCRDRVGWVEYERCLDRCRWGAFVRRALLHLKLAGRQSATHEEARGGGRGEAHILTAMAARLSDPCQDMCHNHKHYDWCVRRCRFGPHLRLAGGGGESEEASGGGVDVLTATAAGAAADPRICEDFCRNWPAPEHDWCLDFCLAGDYVQRAPLHLKLAGGESTTEEEEGEGSGGAVDVPQAAAAAAAAQVQHEAVAGTQPMKNTDPCDDYCMEQTRYFPRPGQFFDCVEECHAGHGRLAGDGRNVIPAAAAQHEAAAGAQPANTDPCEAYCKWHARDFPAKYTACVRQCQSGGHPGDGARVKQERHKKVGEVHLGRGTGKIAIQ